MDRARSLIGLLLSLVCLCATAASPSPLTWTWRNPLPNADPFTVIAFGGGTYVAAGDDGVLYSSTDGVNWLPATNLPIGMGGEYVDALYANGLFVLAGFDSSNAPHVSTSSDGMHWTDSQLSIAPRITPSGVGPQFDPQLELAYGNGIYMLTDYDGDATSPDGVTWTSHSGVLPSISDAIPSLEFANGVFIKMSGIDIFHSVDGVTWSASTNNSFHVGLAGPFSTNGTTFFNFAQKFDLSGPVVLTSPDGDHWIQNVPNGIIPSLPAAVLWDGSRFLSDNQTSTDGITWTTVPHGTSPSSVGGRSGHSITTTGTGYAAVSSGALHILRSTDFSTWTMAFSPSSGPAVDLSRIVYGGGHFVALGVPEASPNHTDIMESADGANWNDISLGNTPIGFGHLAYGGGHYIASDGTNLYSSADAVHWALVPSPPSFSSSDDVAYGNGEFVTLNCDHGSDCQFFTSSDGITWNSRSAPVGITGDGAGTVLDYDGTRFVSIGRFKPNDGSSGQGSAPIYTSCDGSTWTHSADIPASGPANFQHLYTVGSELIATGFGVCTGDPTMCQTNGDPPVVAKSQDGIHWTVVSGLNTGLAHYDFTDIIRAGDQYYATIVGSKGINGDQTALVASADGLGWQRLPGEPSAADIQDFATDGTRLVAVGDGGDIISADVSAVAVPAGGACHALPAVKTGGSSGGGGEANLLALLVLLGLCSARRHRESLQRLGSAPADQIARLPGMR